MLTLARVFTNRPILMFSFQFPVSSSGFQFPGRRFQPATASLPERRYRPPNSFAVDSTLSASFFALSKSDFFNASCAWVSNPRAFS